MSRSGPLGAALHEAAVAVAGRAAGLLGPLVDVSSPSGDRAAIERLVDVLTAALPPGTDVSRLPSSTATSADDLLVRVAGARPGGARILLLGHLDTVVPHPEHRPLRRSGDRLDGSGTFDMKGGDALAVGVLHHLAARPDRVAEVALLLVTDEEWRSAPFAHGARFAGWDACLCFEGGERTLEGDEAVVVRRKAAASIEVTALGRAAHAGSRPQDGANALLALATVARTLADAHDPLGPARRSVVPTVLRSGTALNVVPAHGELVADVRADDTAAIEEAMALVPERIGDVVLDRRFGRRWPGMDHAAAAAPVLARAAALLGRPVLAASRGGASDASHVAAHVGVAIDGLGPLGGGAHAPDEHVDLASLVDRAAVALVVAEAVLEGT